jgi:hypothetical protein
MRTIGILLIIILCVFGDIMLYPLQTNGYCIGKIFAAILTLTSIVAIATIIKKWKQL